MSVNRSNIEAALAKTLPEEVVSALLDEYLNIKKQFFLRNFRPSELNAARFSEHTLRLVEFLNTGKYTPLAGQVAPNTVIGEAEKNTALPEGIRLHITRLTRVLLGVRNNRNVAHTGGEVDPNYSDSLLVSHGADWILVELVRNYHTNDIEEARKIVETINEIKIPVVAEVDEFVRVQNPDLSLEDTILVILYHKHPDGVLSSQLAYWTSYITSEDDTLVETVLQKLHQQCLIHCPHGFASILPRGIAYVEKNISLELIV